MKTPEFEATLFKAMGDAHRLRILRLLLEGESLCVCEIVDTLNLPQYQISRNLNILKQAGLLKTNREGTWIYYSLNDEQPKNQAFFVALKDYLSAEYFKEDINNLNIRLSLRDQGRCVVGFVSEKELQALLNA